MAPLWKNLMKNVDLEEPTSLLDHVYLGCTQRECKLNEIIIEQYREMFESRISATATEKNYQEVKSLTQNRLRGPATWKDMLKNALKDTANWQTKRRSNRTQFQRLAWMITTSRTVGELIVRCMFSNRLEMLVLGSNWWTRHLVDSKQTCSRSHHMDTSV